MFTLLLHADEYKDNLCNTDLEIYRNASDSRALKTSYTAIEQKMLVNDASSMRGLKIRPKGFWCDTMPGVKAVSSMGSLGSSASVKDQRIRATAMYTDLKVTGVLRQSSYQASLSTHRLATCNPGHALKYVQRKLSKIKN